MPPLVEPPSLPLPEERRTHGCFETMQAYGGRIFRLEAHLDRLYGSAQFLGTRAPSDRRRLGRQLTAALARSGLRDAVVRVALIPPPVGAPKAHAASRRSLAATPTGGGMMPQPAGEAKPSIVVQPAVHPPGAAYRRGIAVAVVPARKFSVGSIDPQAKYSARLGSVLAVQDAQLRGVEEALFMDALGGVTESTASNFGIVAHGEVLTPPCWLGLLAGITRDVLFELGTALRIPVREVPLTRHDLYNADEAFLTSTLKEILPVTRIDGRTIGTGRPGSITKRLRRAFQQLVRQELKLT